MNAVLELLKAKHAELRAALVEIEAAIEILSHHGDRGRDTSSFGILSGRPLSDAERLAREKSGAESPKEERTIRSMARRVLEDFPAGMKTRELYEFLTAKVGVEIASPESLYATLTKYTDEFERDDNLWMLRRSSPRTKGPDHRTR